VNELASYGQLWNFYGNAGDFTPGRGVTIPFFSGTSNAACLAKAVALDGGAATGWHTPRSRTTAAMRKATLS